MMFFDEQQKDRTPLLKQKDDFLLTLDELMKLAQEGDSSAQFLIGCALLYGHYGCKINKEEGKQWIVSLAQKNDNSPAFFSAKGFCYEEAWGEVLIKNLEKAKECYEAAAKANYIPAKHYLASLIYNVALTSTASTAHQWNNTVQVTHEHKDQQKLAEAVKIYTECAEKGYAPSIYKLGLCYFEGNGVTEDKKEAVRLFKMAAEKGHGYSKHQLGECYRNAKGASYDLDQAWKWYKAGRKQGIEPSHEALDELDELPLCQGCALI